jgi:hypothetical protein
MHTVTRTRKTLTQIAIATIQLFLRLLLQPYNSYSDCSCNHTTLTQIAHSLAVALSVTLREGSKSYHYGGDALRFRLHQALRVSLITF